MNVYRHSRRNDWTHCKCTMCHRQKGQGQRRGHTWKPVAAAAAHHTTPRWPQPRGETARLWKKSKDVSARVSPVVLARGGGSGRSPPRPRRRPHNCSYGELPRRRNPRGGGQAGVLPFPGGTLCLVARGLSPSSSTLVGTHSASAGGPRCTGVALRTASLPGGRGSWSDGVEEAKCWVGKRALVAVLRPVTG